MFISNFFSCLQWRIPSSSLDPVLHSVSRWLRRELFFSCWFLLNLTLGVWFHLQFMWSGINHTQIDDNQLFIYWLNHLSIYITDIMNFLTSCISYSSPHEVIDLIYLRSMMLRMEDTNLPLTTLALDGACSSRRLRGCNLCFCLLSRVLSLSESSTRQFVAVYWCHTTYQYAACICICNLFSGILTTTLH